MLDIYKPADRGETPLPVIVFFHGGRWTKGEKSQYAFVADRLAKDGFLVVVPDYRNYPAVKFPVFTEDGAAAVAWVHDQISAHGGDPSRIFLTGHSAAAHIGALVATDPKYFQAHGKNRGIITAFADLAGPYDFVSDGDDLKDMFGPPERYAQMQVTRFIDGKQPPMLLLHGEEDDDVKLYNLERFAAAVKAKGGFVETKVYRGVDHIEIIGALTVFWQHKAPVAEDLVAFFKRWSNRSQA